jgi:hypothetical protein
VHAAFTVAVAATLFGCRGKNDGTLADEWVALFVASCEPESTPLDNLFVWALVYQPEDSAPPDAVTARTSPEAPAADLVDLGDGEWANFVSAERVGVPCDDLGGVKLTFEVWVDGAVLYSDKVAVQEAVTAMSTAMQKTSEALDPPDRLR